MLQWAPYEGIFLIADISSLTYFTVVLRKTQINHMNIFFFLHLFHAILQINNKYIQGHPYASPRAMDLAIYKASHTHPLVQLIYCLSIGGLI